MTIDWNNLLHEIETGVLNAAVKDAEIYAAQALSDAAEFIAASTESVAKYIGLYTTEQITASELKSLLLGLGELCELQGLTQAGLAEVELEKIRNTILQTLISIVGTAVKSAVAG